MPTPNHLTSNGAYWRQEGWKEPAGPWLIWPALWYQPGQSRGVFIEEAHWTLGLGPWRWRLVRGRDRSPDLQGPISWQAIEGPAFLDWAHRTFGGSWTAERAQAFFQANPRWRDLVARGHLDNHYLRILIAREMLAGATEAPAATLELDPLEHL